MCLRVVHKVPTRPSQIVRHHRHGSRRKQKDALSIYLAIFLALLRMALLCIVGVALAALRSLFSRALSLWNNINMFLKRNRHAKGYRLNLETSIAPLPLPPPSYCARGRCFPLFCLAPPTSVLGGSSGGAALDDLILVANKADLVGTVEGEGGEHEHELISLAAAAAAGAGVSLPEGSAVAAAEATQEREFVIAARGAEAVRAAEGVETEGDRNRARHQRSRPMWKVSCKTKEGLDGFMEHLEAEVRSRFQGAADDESPLITRCVCGFLWVGVLLIAFLCTRVFF